MQALQAIAAAADDVAPSPVAPWDSWRGVAHFAAREAAAVDGDVVGGLLGPAVEEHASTTAGLGFLWRIWGGEAIRGGWASAVAADDAWRAAAYAVRLENWRRESTSVCGLDILPAAPLPVPERPTPRSLAAVTHTAAARRQAERAAAGIGRALARERASYLLACVERGGWARRLADVEADAVEAADAVAGEVWRDVQGPVCWAARDRARFCGVAARAAAGEARALSTLTRLHDGARARLEGEARRLLHRWAAAQWDRARAWWLRRERDYREARAAAARAKLWRDRDVQFVTLTQRARQGESVAAAVGRLRRAIGKLCRSSTWRNSVAGGVLRLEVERSTPATRARASAHKREAAARLSAVALDVADDDVRGQLMSMARAASDGADALHRRHGSSRGRRDRSSWWHAHAHLAVSTGWIDQARWWKAWEKATGTALPRGSVDVRRPERGPEGIAVELTKYLSKPTHAADLSDVEVRELVAGLAGVRTLRCFGALLGVAVEDGAADRAKEDAEGATLTDALADPTIPVGSVVVDGVARSVCFAEVVWRDDAAAQEVRRQHLARAWAAAQSRRGRAGPDDVPDT